MSNKKRRRQPAAAATSPVLTYLQLLRLPNVFTALADILLGFLFVYPTLQPTGSYVCLLLSSALIYSAGMVLNDVFDVEQDRRERPTRPIPSGRVSLEWARWLGTELLLFGLALSALAAYLATEAAYAWRAPVIALALTVCVFLYDWRLKRTPSGPVAMGACRTLNILLGMSLAPLLAAEGSSQLLYFTYPQLTVALGIGIYIAGVTWFARKEAANSEPLQLASATAVMMAGIGVVGCLPLFQRNAGLREEQWWFLLVFLGVIIGRRCLLAVFHPTPQSVQAAVKNAILSLVMLDAAALLAQHPNPMWSLAIVLLLIPTVLLGKWVYST